MSQLHDFAGKRALGTAREAPTEHGGIAADNVARD